MQLVPFNNPDFVIVRSGALLRLKPAVNFEAQSSKLLQLYRNTVGTF
jgi:hypothetical protein